MSSTLKKNPSVIYKEVEGEIVLLNPKTGNCLGELTNEIGQDEDIVEFVASSAKSYSMAIRSRETGAIRTETKIKGRCRHPPVHMFYRKLFCQVLRSITTPQKS